MFTASFILIFEMSISVLALLCVYVCYNALYIKLFASYNNIFLWRLVNRFYNRFSTTENRFAKKPVLTSLFLMNHAFKIDNTNQQIHSFNMIQSENQTENRSIYEDTYI